MKEEWKVYIKGVPDSGDEVIKVLKDLGGKHSNRNILGVNEDCVYFINHKGDIDYEYTDTEIGKIIMDNYREIKLPEQWWDGDVLVGRGDSTFAVFSHREKSYFVAYMQANGDGVVGYENGVRCNMEDYRLATDEEVNRFYELLHKHGKEWDDEAKILMDCKWKPKEGEDYFFVSDELSVERTSNDGYESDKAHFRYGNCFRTREEAEDMAERIKKLLNGE